jgi:hypothetical protein
MQIFDKVWPWSEVANVGASSLIGHCCCSVDEEIWLAEKRGIFFVLWVSQIWGRKKKEKKEEKVQVPAVAEHYSKDDYITFYNLMLLEYRINKTFY